MSVLLDMVVLMKTAQTEMIPILLIAGSEGDRSF